MAKKHFENLSFLTLEQVQGIFKQSMRTLRIESDENKMLSPAAVKDTVERIVWLELKTLYEAEVPQFASLAPKGGAIGKNFAESAAPPWMAGAVADSVSPWAVGAVPASTPLTSRQKNKLIREKV